MESYQLVATLAALITTFVSGVLKAYLDNQRRKEVDRRVEDAEKKAFDTVPEEIASTTAELRDSQEGLKREAIELAALFESNRNVLQMGSLFNLYSKQIAKYQTQTQVRASWSFIVAIIAMFSGLGLILWCGLRIIGNASTGQIIATSVITVIGGAVSAFITKTFLDIHRLSITQLNHYFQQPVINSHILTAQRLADQLADPVAKQKAYEEIIQMTSKLILAENGAQSAEAEK